MFEIVHLKKPDCLSAFKQCEILIDVVVNNRAFTFKNINLVSFFYRSQYAFLHF